MTNVEATIPPLQDLVKELQQRIEELETELAEIKTKQEASEVPEEPEHSLQNGIGVEVVYVSSFVSADILCTN